MSLADTIQLLVGGLENGLSYGLVGLALVLIFRISHALNFAQGTMGAVAGFAAYELIVTLGLPWVVGALGGLLAALGLGAATERLVIRPLLGSSMLSLVIVTLGVDYILTNLTQLRYGSSTLRFPPPLEGPDVTFGPIVVVRTYLVIAGVALVAVALLTFLLQRTRLGLAMRAFADDPFAAELQGVPASLISPITWTLATGLAGLTGILFAPLLFLQVGYMSPIFLKGFTAGVLGGFVSLGGALVGGLVLGVVEALTVRFAPSLWAPMVPLLVILLVMLLRPNGVFTSRVVASRV